MAALNIFTDPSRAFLSEQTENKAWLPLMVVLLASIVSFLVYYQAVDFAWLQDNLVAAMEPAQREAGKRILTMKALVIGSLLSVVILVPLTQLLLAGYLHLAAKISHSTRTFGAWFALVAWTALPSALFLPLTLGQLLLSKNFQLSPEQLNPFTVNQLLLHLPSGAPWQSLTDSINLLSLWSLGLLIMGVRNWTQRSTVSAAVVVLLPYGVIYGLWALSAALGTR
ncbi:YIP1 family protein [Duganella sp. Leaf126]|uniref:YIP1 family protein n=1 Tax=Duganella sp. Leaf126 TaxID=1736266 RepID=UPI00138F9A4A|nr:YIP1 family protein [Duganella sp. Leaf126]